jgi:hypothetical protein
MIPFWVKIKHHLLRVETEASFATLKEDYPDVNILNLLYSHDQYRGERCFVMPRFGLAGYQTLKEYLIEEGINYDALCSLPPDYSAFEEFYDDHTTLD